MKLSSTYSNLEFSVRPRPNNSESAKGYLLRLAADNGRYDLPKLAATFDYKSKPSSFELGGADFNNFMSTLAKTLRLEPSELLETFSLQPNTVEQGRAVKDIRRKSPKVCPECMKSENTAYIKAEWELAHHTHCEEHSVKLLDRCPHCQTELQWHGDVYEGCPCCGLRWQDFDASPEPIPAYQTICSELSDIELSEYLNGLYRALIIVSRPFDLMFDRFNQLPDQLHNLPLFFEQAFEMICNEQVQWNWEHMRLVQLQANQYFNHIPKNQLETLVKLPCFDRVRRILSTQIAITKNFSLLPSIQNQQVATVRQQVSSYTTDYTNHISLSSAAKLLGIDKKTVNALVELELINAYSGSLTSRVRIVAANSVAKFIRNTSLHAITIDECLPELVSIKELMKGLGYFNCDLSILVKLIVQHRCQIYVKRDKDFSIKKLYLNREEVSGILEQYFTESIQYQISQTKLQQMCNLKTDQFVAFKEKFNLQEVSTIASLAKLNPIQIFNFFDHYVLINRWAKITGVKLKSIVQFLKCEQGLVLVDELETKDIFIFEKSESLTNSLTRYLIYHRGETQLLAQLCS